MGRPDAEVSSNEIDDQSTQLNEHEVGYDQNVQPQGVYHQQTLEQDQKPQQAPPVNQQQQYPPPQQQQYPPPPPPQQYLPQQQQYPPPQPGPRQQYPPPPQQQQFPPQKQQYPPPQQQFPPQKQQNNPAWQGAGPYPPAQFPAQSPQNNSMYGMNNPPSYPPPPPGTQQAGVQGQSTYPPQPVSFPPKADFAQRNMQMPPSPYTSTVSGIPVNQNQLPMQNGAWSSELFDCLNDPTNALITAFLPCVTFGQIAEIVDEGRTPCGTSGLIYGVIAGLIGIPCVMSCTYRTKIRSQYGLMETPAPDWITHFLCEWCALCQEYRELSARGFDPAIGWHGNLQLRQQQMAMMPPTNQAMNMG